ncbi:hypothetical protein GCM10009609_39870 [Pseudonocardia aurantiaca]|uniref:Uncharacterized protein n=1 Tax=Pseudonocardia aurantiaca TaxID=75290 RepID=A0ABW4FN02_9PSEU
MSPKRDAHSNSALGGSKAELSLVRFRNSNASEEWYIVANPLGRYVITSRGDIRGQISKAARIGAASSAITAGLLVATWSAATAPSTGWVIARFIVGGAIGLASVWCLATLILWLSSAISAAHAINRDRCEVYVRVTPDDTRGWRLCQIAEAINDVAAWRDGTVDPGRRVSLILWSAIRRTVSVAERLDDAKRASAYPSLSGVAHEALRTIGLENDALDQVHLNLGRILLAAQSVDQQQRDIEGSLKARIHQEREEELLRRRLSGGPSTLDLHDSREEADRSAGAAAESQAIAQLLAESEQILRGAD